ncbi:MAG: hypothetical protein ABII10_00415, partial [Candidatus Paceibacterota bacterium]
KVTARVYKESGNIDDLGWGGLSELEQKIIIFICRFRFGGAKVLADSITSESSKERLYEFIDQWERDNLKLMQAIELDDPSALKNIADIKNSFMVPSPSAQE